MAVSRAKGSKAKCDRLFSLIIRARGGCQNCPERRYEQLQTAHIISRRYSHTRCDIDNAYCLCAACHRRFTDYPASFGEFVRETIGQLAYDDLVLKSQERTKVDWDDELVCLKAIWSAIEAAA